MMKTVKQHNIQPNDVKEIKVEVIARAADILGDPHKYRPDSKETADHSLPYCMAAGLVDGAVGLRQYDDARVRARDLTVMRAITTLVADDRIARDAARRRVARARHTIREARSFLRA